MFIPVPSVDLNSTSTATALFNYARSATLEHGFHPFEPTAPHIAYAVLGGFVVFFGLFSLFIKEKLYIGEAVIATVFGIIVGPHAGNVFSPTSWAGGNDEVVNEITLEFARVVVAIGVFAVGVELPKAYVRHHWKSLAWMLGPVMLVGWFISAALIFVCIPGLSFLAALTIAACVTPTDPILAAAVVGGKFAEKHVPGHLRHLLSAESGSNDGAAFPFLYIGLYLLIDSDDPIYAVQEWFTITWLYNIVLSIILGTILGFVARKLMRFCEEKKLVDRESFVASYISLALLSIGIGTLLGSDDLLAAFSCGCAFAWDGFFNKATEDSGFSNVIDLLFNTAIFIFIGATIPFEKFNDAASTLTSWRLVVLSISILILRRLPFMLIFYRWIPDVKTIREAAFVGWTGPIGVGAIFFSSLAVTKLAHPNDPPQNQSDYVALLIQPVVYFMVLSSIIVHGLSVPFFSLGKRVHSIHLSRTLSIQRSRSLSRSRSNFGSTADHSHPGWSSHVRRVMPGQDIQINRDEVDQKSESLEKIPEDNVSSVIKASQSASSSGTINGDSLRKESGSSTPDQVEWVEGHNIVVEHRKKNGEIEVTVHEKDRDLPEGDAVQSKSFSGSKFEDIEHELSSHIDSLKPKTRRASHSEPGTSDQVSPSNINTGSSQSSLSESSFESDDLQNGDSSHIEHKRVHRTRASRSSLQVGAVAKAFGSSRRLGGHRHHKSRRKVSSLPVKKSSDPDLAEESDYSDISTSSFNPKLNRPESVSSLTNNGSTTIRFLEPQIPDAVRSSSAPALPALGKLSKRKKGPKRAGTQNSRVREDSDLVNSVSKTSDGIETED